MLIADFEKKFNIILSPDWKKIFEKELNKKSFQNLINHINQLYETDEVYPAKHNLWKAFEFTPLENLKGIILGQDPYHKKNLACGLSFSVPENEKIPPSLSNIFKELFRSHGIVKTHGNLESWAKNGILLLNTILTVLPGKPLSHSKIGWQYFTNEIISYISKYKKNVFFLLLGTKAQQIEKLIDLNKHTVFKLPHPSPLSRKKFVGCDCFKDIDHFFNSHNMPHFCW